MSEKANTREASTLTKEVVKGMFSRPATDEVTMWLESFIDRVVEFSSTGSNTHCLAAWVEQSSKAKAALIAQFMLLGEKERWILIEDLKKLHIYKE